MMNLYAEIEIQRTQETLLRKKVKRYRKQIKGLQKAVRWRNEVIAEYEKLRPDTD